MKKIFLKICLITVALLGAVNVVVASDSYDCPSIKGSWWDNCIGSETYANGDKYTGQFKDNKKDGQGTITYPLGGKYVGEWKENEKSGQGTYTSSSGAKYVGEFKDDSYNGQGSYIYANGATYVGQFKEDERSGQGAYTYVDGKIEEGIWKGDKFQYAQTPKPSLDHSSFICSRATTLISGKKAWVPNFTNFYVVEAKKRNLSCGIEFNSAIPIIEIETCVTNANKCSESELCGRASYFTGSQRLWDKAKSSQKYVTEAKKRNLSCGVGYNIVTPSIKIETCVTNAKKCSEAQLCGRASYFTGSQRLWDKAKFSQKYVTEAKERNLSCGVSTPTPWSDLPDCPSNINARWDNCFGTFTYDDGSIYRGEWKDNSSVGQGIYTYLNGDKYVGEFKDDIYNGQGTYTYENGRSYVGEWKDGKSNGQGTETYADGTVEEGIFKDDEFQYAKKPAQSSEITSGSVSNLPNCPSDSNARWHNCFGTFTFESGNKYVGAFQDNAISGQGTYIYISGSKYVGEFKDNKRNGYGTFTYADGEEYVGQFKDSKKNGQGTLTFVNGGIYTGGFKDNKLSGQGSLTFGQDSKWQGDKYVGGFKDGKRDGQGTYTFANGTVERGIWKANEFQNTTASKPSKDPELVPSAPKKKPEMPIKPALLLDNPLHIKAYGKSYHSPLLPNVLFFIGEIEDGDEQGFRRALRDHEIATVVLVSQGGLISNGLELANIIYDNNLATYIPSRETCASACSFMYFAGNPKVAHGRLGVHQFYLDDDKKKVSIGTAQKGTQLLVADIIQNLTDFGTPSSVFSKMFSTSNMYYFSEEEKRSFSNTEMSDGTIAKINELLLYFTKYVDDELDQDALNGMPQGMKNRLLQLELIRIGCMQGPVDGIKGETTTSAIQLLSSKRGANLMLLKFSDLFRSLNKTKQGACY